MARQGVAQRFTQTRRIDAAGERELEVDAPRLVATLDVVERIVQQIERARAASAIPVVPRWIAI
jgi:hypothetical protein